MNPFFTSPPFGPENLRPPIKPPVVSAAVAVQFPRTAAAVLAVAEAQRQRDQLSAAAAPVERARLHMQQLVAREAVDAAEAAALAAYGDELLPALLGAQHRPSSAPPERMRLPREAGGPFLDAYSARCALLDHCLFDHQQLYRRAPALGHPAWSCSALLGMPYNVFRGRGGLAPSAVEAARRLHEAGIGVWARPDLSGWNPGDSQLVIAAPGLLDRDPTAFGFVAPATIGPLGLKAMWLGAWSEHLA